MVIIKSEHATTLLKDAIVMDLGDVARQARAIRESAEAKANNLIQEAQAQVESLRRTAHDESAAKGYQEGFDKGLEEGRQQGHQAGHQEAVKVAGEALNRIQQAWTDAMQQWDASRQDIERELRRTVVTFAICFAQKIVHRAIEVNPDVVVDQLTEVLSHVLRPMDVVVRVCHEDRAVLEEAMPRLLSDFSLVNHIDLVEDESVSRGGCVVSYGQGQIDASMETQLKRLTELMM